MNLQRIQRRQHGFSMLEVLIAVLVFSLGMIGLAGLLIYSINSNHVAYLRTQATFLAHNMAARMGANPAGVWNNDYNITAIDAAGTTPPSCAGGCSPAALATYDIAVWSQQLHTFLPAAQASINCAYNGNVQATVDLRPPYGGACSMTISWSEANAAGAAQQTSLGAGAGEQQLHTFAWVFQP